MAGTWELMKRFTFEASHMLPRHDGKCKRLHGHSWSLTVCVKGGTLHQTGPKQGMLVDYGDISAQVKPLIDGFLDHWHLNDTVDPNPTSEVIAKWVFDKLKPLLPGLDWVVVGETCTCECRYYGD